MMSAIVSSDVFDTEEGYVTLLHEFVHCAQALQGEVELKNRLKIAQEYKSRNDYIWEINHAFPYEDHLFTDLFLQYLNLLTKGNHTKVSDTRLKLGDILDETDKEYLLWRSGKKGLPDFLRTK